MIVKRYLFVLLLLLSACERQTDNKLVENENEEKALEELVTEQEDEWETEVDEFSDEESDVGFAGEAGDLSTGRIREVLEHEALSEGDKLIEASIKDNEIAVIVEIGESDFIDDKSLLAEMVYDRAGEALLKHGGWEVLTIEFVNIGKVSMNQNEKESNEFGDYFPIEDITEQLGNL